MPSRKTSRRHRSGWRHTRAAQLGLETLEERCMLAAGALDTSFGFYGGTRTDVLALRRDNFIQEIAVQSDGKIVAAGWIEADSDGLPNANVNSNILLARFNADGTLDQTFFGNGFVSKNLGSRSRAHSVVIQPDDGKIVVGGYTNVFGTRDFVVFRYLPDGNLDTSFGTDGYSVVNVPVTDESI